MKRHILCIVLMLGLTAAAESAAEYEQMFIQLAAMVNGPELTPPQMVTGSWLGMKYFTPDDGRMTFNRTQYIAAESMGEAAVSGLFLAMHGDSRTRLFVRRELETDLSKRRWLWLTVGTEEVFFKQLRNGMKLQSLTNVLPSTDGLRAQCRLLMQSGDPLTRRAGLLWGFWLPDDGYRWGVNYMATEDTNPVNRACAMRLLSNFK